MARRKRTKWEHGDLFAVPLVDASIGIIQAVDHWMPNWVYAAVTNQRVPAIPLKTGWDGSARVIALVAVSSDEFDFGKFPHIGPAPSLVRREDFPNERYARDGYVGAKSYTGSIVVELLSAWHGLAPWSPYKDPEYFDKLLVAGVKRPEQTSSVLRTK